jgi:hypothetical protein
VISANIHRRHLTVEKKRELIGKLLKADPTKSDRAIAKTTKTDHKTVASVRARKEATGEIPQLKKTVGADGKTRKRPAKKKQKAAKVEPEPERTRPPPMAMTPTSGAPHEDSAARRHPRPRLASH